MTCLYICDGDRLFKVYGVWLALSADYGVMGQRSLTDNIPDKFN